jgi:hypothetical protein
MKLEMVVWSKGRSRGSEYQAPTSTWVRVSREIDWSSRKKPLESKGNWSGVLKTVHPSRKISTQARIG